MIYLHGAGHFHPENIIDNQFLENLQIETNNEWILERVGIRERRTVLCLDYIRQTYNQSPVEAHLHLQFSTAELGANAARMAMLRANVKPEDIGMVIAGGCLPQYSMPAEACAVAAELGIEATAFDINSACSTFAAHMFMVSQMQSDNLPDYILLVSPESVTRSIHYADRKVAVLWGDCASAVIVSKKIKSNKLIAYTTLSSDPKSWGKVVTPAGGHFYQEGQAVQKFAIKKTLATLQLLREKCDLNSQQHYFIGHQANLTMLNSVCSIANVAEDKHLYNVDRFGNCGAAGAPSVLSENWLRFVAGDQIVLAVAGAGLTWGGMVIKVS